MHVHVASLEAAVDLQRQGFDLAGVNQRDSTVGLVVDEAGLERLKDLGYDVTVGESNDAPETIAALSDYTDPQEMSAFMTQVAATYPGLAQKFTIQQTLFEGQSQYAIKITKDVGLPNDRPTFVLDAQHHAREVMTTEIAKDAIDYLTSRYATDSQVRRWVDSINIWIVGSVNPDGGMYVFTTDSFWRKNRHPSCAVDPNRNYPFAWGSCNGSSASCSDDTTRGLEPGSEPEVRGMLQLFADTHAFYSLSYHTYGEYIMYPYGCNNPDEMTALQEVAQGLNAILQNDNGATGQYHVGPIWSTIYLVDGGSVDTDYAQQGTYAFTIEANCCQFQPDYATWRNVTVQRQRTAWQFFLDRTLDAPAIRGKITDAVSAAPLAASVSMDEVTYTHGEQPRHADPRGLYHWLARSGQTYHLNYSMPGYCPVTRTVDVGSGPSIVDVTLAQPQPPSSVQAAAVGDGAIDVTWTATANATGYRVLRSLDAAGPFVEVGFVSAPDTIFHDTGLSGSVPYTYVVRSMQPCESSNSATASATTTGPCTVGPAFAGAASVTNAESTVCAMTVAWPAAGTRCGGGVTYAVYRSATSPFTPGPSTLVASGVTATTYTDHDALTDGATMHYVVRAVDAGNGADDGNAVDRAGAPTGPVTTGTWTDDGGDTGTAKLTLAAPWSVLPAGGKAGPKVYATGTYGNNLCTALTTPTISVQAGSSLSFASKYDIETNWDVGIVEVSQDPTFSTWTKLTVNYPDSLANSGNACGIPTSFAGTVFSRQFTTPVYPASNYQGSLAAYAGKDIRLRWRFSSDTTATFKGWWIDDVAVTNAALRAVCSAGPGSKPAEAGATGSPMTASRGTGTSVSLGYGPACSTTANTVYVGTGPIAGAPAWTQAYCGVGNTGLASFDPGDPPPDGWFYFVIVGQNGSVEGSYGAMTSGERPEAAGVGSCDLPRDLTGCF